MTSIASQSAPTLPSYGGLSSFIWGDIFTNYIDRKSLSVILRTSKLFHELATPRREEEYVQYLVSKLNNEVKIRLKISKDNEKEVSWSQLFDVKEPYAMKIEALESNFKLVNDLYHLMIESYGGQIPQGDVEKDDQFVRFDALRKKANEMSLFFTPLIQFERVSSEVVSVDNRGS